MLLPCSNLLHLGDPCHGLLDFVGGVGVVLQLAGEESLVGGEVEKAVAAEVEEDDPLLAGLAGILYCARLGSSTGQAGMGLELKVIAGVVVGGASLKGGKGTILGGILGPLFMALVFNIMGILGVDAYWQRIVNGSILIFAVFTDVVMEHDYFKRRLGRKAG